MFRVTAKTHTGAVREHNEDAFYCDQSPDSQDQGFVVVADGMGGYAAGEVASDIVVKTLAELKPKAEALVAALVECHQRIVSHAQANPESKGMGAAVVAARFNPSQVAVCWAGDARAYLFHPKRGLAAVSRDHSYVQLLLAQGQLTEEQARTHPDRNLVTQCLGINPPQPELTTASWTEGDTLLLCSDGLTDELDDAAIRQILLDAGSIEAAADQLIEAALKSGGRDNITVILAENLCAPSGAENQNIASEAEQDSEPVSWLPIVIGVGAALLVAVLGGALLFLKN